MDEAAAGVGDQADTDSGDHLIEAHLFRRLKVAEDIQTLYLSRQRPERDAGKDWTDVEWNAIRQNAREWCQRNGVRLVQIP
jgi:hypothetical protein